MKQRGRRPTPASVDRGSARSGHGSASLDQARALLKAGRFADAEATARRVVASHPRDAAAHIVLASALRKQRKPSEAVLALRAAVEIDPKDATVLHNLGAALREANRAAEAEFALKDAIAADPNLAEAHLDLGLLYANDKQFEAAEAAYRNAIAVRPSIAAAHYNLGNLLRETGRLQEAVDAYKACLKDMPDHPSSWYNMGIALKALGRSDEAISAYREAIGRRPDHSDALNNLGVLLRARGDIEEAERTFRGALAARDFPLPYVNLAALLRDQAKIDDAIAMLKQCLKSHPEHISAGAMAADLLDQNGRPEEAEQLLRQLLDQNRDRDSKRRRVLHEALGKLFRDRERLPEAVREFQEVLRIDPEHAESMAGSCFAKAAMCDWRHRDEEFAHLMRITERQIAAGTRTALTSFSALARPLSPATHLAISRTWANETKQTMSAWRRRLDFGFARSRRHDRLRIAYVSQDFRNQAMGHLTRTMFGLHDRAEFEIFGYSVRKSDNSIYRKTIEADCEHFMDIHDVGVPKAAQQIYRDEIDIMVDLMGYTSGNRMGITALHPAPVTVGFLQYPGSSGADFVDYMLTDPVVTRPSDQPDYSEQLVFLPNCYQPNDWTQQIDPAPARRADWGLPENAFVFCCFNNHYKLEPSIFAIWMRILRQVPNSVLWLLKFNEPMVDNLRREAEANGVLPSRLLFADKIGKARHLARQRLADLFLDTRYYTAHTTCSDALWAGLPVLSCPGETFASRVAASILKAAGVPELIVSDFDAYERMAVHLATHPSELRTIRDKCIAQRSICPLFDTRRFVRDLEQAYRLIWDNWLAGHPPRQLFVTESHAATPASERPAPPV